MSRDTAVVLHKDSYLVIVLAAWSYVPNSNGPTMADVTDSDRLGSSMICQWNMYQTPGP